jgi:SAM-dependent methyltransferase
MALRGGGSTYHASDGPAYEVFLGRWTQRLAEPFLDFAEFPAGGRLLDVGCGTGSLARAMATRWPARPVTGVDIAAPYVEFARAQPRLESLDFEIADAARLPYADATFAGCRGPACAQFRPRSARCLERDAPGDGARRPAGGNGVGLSRRPALSAHLLGYRRRHRCWRGQRARPVVFR